MRIRENLETRFERERVSCDEEKKRRQNTETAYADSLLERANREAFGKENEKGV